MTNITQRLGERFRLSLERSRERRDHDRAISDERVRAEHDAGRARDVAAGGSDCYFCV